MPRIANETNALLADLTRRLEKLVDVARAEGRADALEEVRALVGGTATGGAKRGRPRKAAAATTQSATKKTAKKKRKNPWATMTPAQKKDRVRKMLAGRGLKPKGERGGAKRKTSRSTAKK